MGYDVRWDMDRYGASSTGHGPFGLLGFVVVVILIISACDIVMGMAMQ